MSIVVNKVETHRDLVKFVRFPETLYRDNPCYIPPLEFDQIATLHPTKATASEFCEYELYLAYKDGVLAGRVAAIVNKLANERWDHMQVRFGWLDFIDDREVSAALMDKVYDFGRRLGMTEVVGPLGFTDFDPEGMLVDGFDCQGTMALIYNHPYYNDHIQAMGFEKDADWIEYKLDLTQGIPEKFKRIAAIVEHRSGVHVKKLTRREVRKNAYGEKLFHLINECYKDLYNFTILPDSMADKYLSFYLKVLDLNGVCLLENEAGEQVGFGVIMPGLFEALKKSRGRLFPFGWWHLLKSMYLKREKCIELLLIGVRPDYQNTGINTMVFDTLFKVAMKHGAEYAETNAILETNVKNQSQMALFPHECKKRRRSYKKSL